MGREMLDVFSGRCVWCLVTLRGYLRALAVSPRECAVAAAHTTHPWFAGPLRSYQGQYAQRYPEQYQKPHRLQVSHSASVYVCFLPNSLACWHASPSGCGMRCGAGRYTLGCPHQKSLYSEPDSALLVVHTKSLWIAARSQ